MTRVRRNDDIGQAQKPLASDSGHFKAVDVLLIRLA
jgi:hypothetical protein